MRCRLWPVLSVLFFGYFGRVDAAKWDGLTPWFTGSCKHIFYLFHSFDLSSLRARHLLAHFAVVSTAKCNGAAKGLIIDS